MPLGMGTSYSYPRRFRSSSSSSRCCWRSRFLKTGGWSTMTLLGQQCLWRALPSRSPGGAFSCKSLSLCRCREMTLQLPWTVEARSGREDFFFFYTTLLLLCFFHGEELWRLVAGDPIINNLVLAAIPLQTATLACCTSSRVCTRADHEV